VLFCNNLGSIVALGFGRALFFCALGDTLPLRAATLAGSRLSADEDGERLAVTLWLSLALLLGHASVSVAAWNAIKSLSCYDLPPETSGALGDLVAMLRAFWGR
jgi:hypothetical protein